MTTGRSATIVVTPLHDDERQDGDRAPPPSPAFDGLPALDRLLFYGYYINRFLQAKAKAVNVGAIAKLAEEWEKLYQQLRGLNSRVKRATTSDDDLGDLGRSFDNNHFPQLLFRRVSTSTVHLRNAVAEGIEKYESQNSQGQGRLAESLNLFCGWWTKAIAELIAKADDFDKVYRASRCSDRWRKRLIRSRRKTWATMSVPTDAFTTDDWHSLASYINLPPYDPVSGCSVTDHFAVWSQMEFLKALATDKAASLASQTAEQASGILTHATLGYANNLSDQESQSSVPMISITPMDCSLVTAFGSPFVPLEHRGKVVDLAGTLGRSLEAKSVRDLQLYGPDHPLCHDNMEKASTLAAFIFSLENGLSESMEDERTSMAGDSLSGTPQRS